MGTRIPQGFAAFVLSAAIIASGVSASAQNGNPQVGPAVVSVDVLRHPVTPKVRQLLLKAIDKEESGDYETAIRQLQETLRKYPDSAPYVHNLLGVAYVKTDQFNAAVSSLEQAALLLPHDPMTHYNFGLALICAGDDDRAAQEIQRALELDPGNAIIRARLNAILKHKRSGN